MEEEELEFVEELEAVLQLTPEVQLAIEQVSVPPPSAEQTQGTGVFGARIGAQTLLAWGCLEEEEDLEEGRGSDRAPGRPFLGPAWLGEERGVCLDLGAASCRLEPTRAKGPQGLHLRFASWLAVHSFTALSKVSASPSRLLLLSDLESLRLAA